MIPLRTSACRTVVRDDLRDKQRIGYGPAGKLILAAAKVVAA